MKDMMKDSMDYESLAAAFVDETQRRGLSLICAIAEVSILAQPEDIAPWATANRHVLREGYWSRSDNISVTDVKDPYKAALIVAIGSIILRHNGT